MSEERNGVEKALFFTLGAFMGAAVALLFAPHSGEETRRKIAARAREGTDFVTSQGKNITEKATTYVERSRDILQHQRDQLNAALEAGKAAYREEKEKAKV